MLGAVALTRVSVGSVCWPSCRPLHSKAGGPGLRAAGLERDGGDSLGVRSAGCAALLRLFLVVGSFHMALSLTEVVIIVPLFYLKIYKKFKRSIWNETFFW